MVSVEWDRSGVEIIVGEGDFFFYDSFKQRSRDSRFERFLTPSKVVDARSFFFNNIFFIVIEVEVSYKLLRYFLTFSY